MVHGKDKLNDGKGHKLAIKERIPGSLNNEYNSN